MNDKSRREFIRWGLLWRSDNRLDGKKGYLIGTPDACEGGKVLTFSTRDRAREYVKTNFAYIGHRMDLQSEPHGWKVPKVVKIKATYEAME